MGDGDNAREILSESITSISQALRTGSESSKISVFFKIIFVIGSLILEYLDDFHSTDLHGMIYSYSCLNAWQLSLLLVQMTLRKLNGHCSSCGKLSFPN